ncbi:nucleotidyltransferase [Caminicella sporogenes]|uniref:nucleotidyltransferase n=1 Tax=Caminicella sporogenes TaxID=166485 RepID=UPI002540D3BD|nr:nucleotidyltransferase [Caminicella sporogenes]WIF94603.1 nucleotidyltransferase [Caminicella sporogenes]
MKILGIIAEYNPFHNGHKYHLNKSLKITGATHTIAVMSGNFLQRGEPALFDKWERAKMCIKEGLDLVIELPTIYACNSAEFFAKGSISILNSLNIVDYICFGSESGKIENLKNIADILCDEPKEYKLLLKKYLNTGITFPKARELALKEYLKQFSILNMKEDVLNSPNNILAIEYLKALKQLNSSIKPITIERIKADYNSDKFYENICSATAIRKFLLNNLDKIDTLKNVIPENSFEILIDNILKSKGPIFIHDLEQIIFYKLRTASPNDLKQIHDINEGLENRLKKACLISNSLKELIDNIKTKRYALTRIQRILINSLINITKSDIELIKKDFQPKYLRILGFSKKGTDIIKMIKKSCDIPIITNLKQYYPQDKIAKRILEIDIISSDIYSLLYKNKSMRRGSYDYIKKPYIDFK